MPCCAGSICFAAQREQLRFRPRFVLEMHCHVALLNAQTCPIASVDTKSAEYLGFGVLCSVFSHFVTKHIAPVDIKGASH